MEVTTMFQVEEVEEVNPRARMFKLHLGSNRVLGHKIRQAGGRPCSTLKL